MSFSNALGTVELGDDGVAVLTLAMAGRANKINRTFGEGLTEALDHVFGIDGIKGLVITSGHRDFCVGADLEMIMGERDPAAVYALAMSLDGVFRRLETSGVPVVAALNGTALGGGYELALACHHRIAIDDARIQVGLPEVNLGVIPGGGGTQRLPRLIGIQAGLEIIAQAKQLRAPKAVKAGLVDALAADPQALLEAARAWCIANPDAKQPWDVARYRIPGGVRPGTPAAANLYTAAAAMLYKKTAGAYPAAEAALSVVQSGLRLTFDRAIELEARTFARLATSDGAKDMIRTLFFHRQAAAKGEGLPQVAEHGFSQVAVLGAGMMGAGLAYVCAKAGLKVVLKDISEASLERGMAHIDAQIARRDKHRSEEARAELRARITPTLALEDLAGTDLVIEAVFESLELKHRVTKEVLPFLTDNAVFASNTSAIPITSLAEAATDPERFIGLHFFSPVEQMPLLEIIRGEATSDETLARCLALSRAIGKLPVVVNDGYGFFTSNVFTSYILEGARMVAEGHDPAVVEWAGKSAGMAVPPLQVFDEVTLELGRKALVQAAAFHGTTFDADAGVNLVMSLVEAGRPGRAGGAGFYDYDDKGKRVGLWPGLRELAGDTPASSGTAVLSRRLLLAQVAEVARLFDRGIVRSPADADVMAVFGLGFAPNTGGPVAWMNRQGLASLVAELDGLAAEHGERYAPSAWLRAKAAASESLYSD